MAAKTLWIEVAGNQTGNDSDKTRGTKITTEEK